MRRKNPTRVLFEFNLALLERARRPERLVFGICRATYLSFSSNSWAILRLLQDSFSVLFVVNIPLRILDFCGYIHSIKPDSKL